MKRGEIWTASAGGYAGKPRPVVVLQDDRFDSTASVTIAAFTSDTTEAPLFRLVIEPSELNRLNSQSSLMIDKITTVPKQKIGKKLGRLGDEDLVRVNRAIAVFLGLA